MPDTVTVAASQGSPYTWASAGFTWSSASARKNWSTAYPAIYSVAVAATFDLVEASTRQWTKRSSESLPIAETRSHLFTLREFEAVGFSETYSDLIVFVLRWVESMTFTEILEKASRKEVWETFQGSDHLAQAITKISGETLGVFDALGQSSIKRLPETLTLAELSERASVKNVPDALGLVDSADRVITKRISELIAIGETYADLIAFVLRISEGLSINDMGVREFQKPISETFTTTDEARLQSIKRLSEAAAVAEVLGRAVAYRRDLTDGFSLSDALQKATALAAREALTLAEQYRRHANGVISDMIVASSEITEDDFAAIVASGHPPGYTDFRDFIQGDYAYRRALFRAILNSRNSDRGFIDALRVTVDVPDVFDRGTAQVTDPDAGMAITFSRSFRVPPEVTMTQRGGTALAIPRLLGAITTTGFSAVLENGSGMRVAGAFTWIAQGY